MQFIRNLLFGNAEYSVKQIETIEHGYVRVKHVTRILLKWFPFWIEVGTYDNFKHATARAAQLRNKLLKTEKVTTLDFNNEMQT